MHELTIYYDSHCPLCMAEMLQLKAHDSQGKIRFADLHAEGFVQQYPHIDPAAAYKILHVEMASGEMLYGLDASYKIWSAVGKHKWLFILRLPVIRWFADRAYVFFARYREQISFLLSGKKRCTSCSISAND